LGIDLGNVAKEARQALLNNTLIRQKARRDKGLSHFLEYATFFGTLVGIIVGTTKKLLDVQKAKEGMNNATR
jgi:hypothetical protein